jgi:iron complex outermembrane recepter protein
MKKTISIAVFLLHALFSYSQCDLTLSGKVIDEHDKQPLEFATLYIRETGTGAISDSLGNYLITGLCPGTYTIICLHIGCDSISERITIEANKVKNFYPEHHLHELGLINIVSEKTPVKTTQSSYEMKGRELDEKRGESLGEALKTITGVGTIQTGASISKPVIHGMHSNRILVLNNGIRQEGQQWGSEHAPEIDPFIANKLTVIKGANSVRYGSDAIAGVILVEPNKLRDSAGIGAEVNLVGMSNGKAGIASVMLEQNFKKIPALSWRLQGTLKESGNINTPTYYLKNTGIKEYNFSAAAGWKKEKYGAELFYSQFNTTLGIFSGSHIGNVSDLYDAINRTEPIEKGEFTYAIDRPYQHIEHELFKVKAFVLTGNAGKLSLTYARQYNLRYEFDKDKPLNDSLAALNKPELQFEITSHSADIAWEHNRFKYITGTLGVSGMTQGNTYSGRYFIPNYRNYSGGVYWIEKYSRNKIQLEAGVRYDYKWLRIYKYEGNVIVSPIYKYENVSGTLGTIYNASSKLALNFNAGRAWRPPGVHE